MDAEVPDAVRAIAVQPGELAGLGLDLPAGEPREVHRVAGLLVLAQALFRSSWSEDIDMSLARASAMRRDEPRPGETLPAGDAVLVDTVNERGCMLCNGSGQAAFDAAPRSAILGEKFGYPGPAPCTDCDGTGNLVTAKVKMVSDQRATLRDVFLPTELQNAPGLISLERIVEGIVPVIPDEAFRCHDLRKIAEVSAYRGAQKQQDPTFFGSSFRDTIELGASAVDTFLRGKGRVLHSDIRAYAWPLLWLRYGQERDASTIEIVVLRDAHGVAHRIRSDEVAPRRPSPA